MKDIGSFRCGSKITTAAVAMVLAAVAGMFVVDKAYAGSCGTNECVYASLCYGHGACLHGQMCSSGTWSTSTDCPNTN